MMYVEEFEKLVAQYYGAPYGVAVDCCTHAIELCLILDKPSDVTCPKFTYLSVPMTFKKLNISWQFTESLWENYYSIGNTNVIDAAVLWRENSYLKGKKMCLSFQFKKHLNLGRGGMILLDNKDEYEILKKMRYDGRTDDKPWAEQDVDIYGYHYYMTPETAVEGIKRFYEVRDVTPKQWSYKNYPDISSFKVFNNVK